MRWYCDNVQREAISSRRIVVVVQLVVFVLVRLRRLKHFCMLAVES